MEIRFVERTDPDLVALSRALDDFYFTRFGSLYLDYMPHNTLDGLACAAIAYADDGAPCGCACWRAFDAVTAEIKRVYVQPDCRRMGAARQLLEAVERHAAASGCHRAVVETARETPEAVAFYQAAGYRELPEGYGAYVGDDDCICLEKEVSDGTMR